MTLFRPNLMEAEWATVKTTQLNWKFTNACGKMLKSSSSEDSKTSFPGDVPHSFAV